MKIYTQRPKHEETLFTHTIMEQEYIYVYIIAYDLKKNRDIENNIQTMNIIYHMMNRYIICPIVYVKFNLSTIHNMWFLEDFFKRKRWWFLNLQLSSYPLKTYQYKEEQFLGDCQGLGK